MPDLFIKTQTTSEKPITEVYINTVQSPKNMPSEKHIHVLSSFCRNPIGISFENQKANEDILLFLRKHFITNTFWLVFSVFLLILPFLLRLLSPIFGFDTFFSFLPERYSMIFLLFYYLLVVSYVFINFITWFFNISLITRDSVVGIDFSDIIYKNVAAMKISLIQDINFTQTGTIRTLFDYGDVFTQTVGTLDNFYLEAVPHPELVVQIIENIIGRNKNAV